MDSPFFKLPLNNLTPNAHLLVIGLPKSGKTTLSKLLLKHIGNDFSLTIRKAESIKDLQSNDLVHPTTTIRPRIDLIIYLLDLQQARSLNHLKEQIGILHPIYQFGKFIILCNNYTKTLNHAIDLAEIERYLESYFDLITMYTDLDMDHFQNSTIKQILLMLKKQNLPSGGTKLLSRCLNGRFLQGLY